MRLGTWGLVAAAVALSLPPAGDAVAQVPEPDPNVPVQQRARPDYDPLGLRAGAFLIYPALSLQQGYDSNVFAETDNEKDAFLTVVAPRIAAVSQWSRHRLQLSGRTEHGFYSEYTRNNYHDFEVGADGRVDITREDRVNLDLSFGRGHEDRDSPDDQGRNVAKGITQFYELESNLAYRHDFAQFFTVLRGGFQRLDFEDTAGNVDNDDRDRNRFSTGLRLGYTVSPRINVFVDGAYRWVRYDTTDDAGRKRDNEGYSLRVGSGIDFTGILFGEFFVGYTAVEYDDDDFDSVSTPSAGGRLTWNVTPLTSIILNAVGEVRETTVTQDGEEASGNQYADVSLAVWHELLRNVLINGFAQYTRDDFEGINRTDNTFRVGGGLRYLINRNFSLDGGYNFSTRDSDNDDVEYDRHQVRIGITAQL